MSVYVLVIQRYMAYIHMCVMIFIYIYMCVCDMCIYIHMIYTIYMTICTYIIYIYVCAMA